MLMSQIVVSTLAIASLIIGYVVNLVSINPAFSDSHKAKYEPCRKRWLKNHSLSLYGPSHSPYQDSIAVALAYLSELPLDAVIPLQCVTSVFPHGSSHYSSRSLREPHLERRKERERMPSCEHSRLPSHRSAS